MSLPELHAWKNWLPAFAPPSESERGMGEIASAAAISGSTGTGPISTMRCFDQWALVYSIAGIAFYRDANGTERTVYPGDCILVFPGHLHTYGPVGKEKWNELYIAFRGPLFELWMESGLLQKEDPVFFWADPLSGLERFRDFFDKLALCNGLQALCLLQALLAEVLASQTGESTSKLPAAKGAPAWLPKAKHLLGPSHATSLTLEEISQQCGVGYESFRKAFEAWVGIPPRRYAQQRRLEEAKRLLSMRSRSNKEIAELLGFYDEYHFSKAFTQYAGISPRGYRRALKSEGSFSRYP